jgi:hypothetical protein
VARRDVFIGLWLSSGNLLLWARRLLLLYRLGITVFVVAVLRGLLPKFWHVIYTRPHPHRIKRR